MKIPAELEGNLEREELTKPGSRNRFVAALSMVMVLVGGVSIILILSKYCLTLVSSVKTGCSRALMP
jgi:hypothetical protein